MTSLQFSGVGVRYGQHDALSQTAQVKVLCCALLPGWQNTVAKYA